MRNKIREAALSEFKREGYLQASMRRIAQAAGVTSGNIYRYYESKEQLFDAIVQPVFEQYTVNMKEIHHKVELSYQSDERINPVYFKNIESTLVELFKTYSSELTIMLNQSTGTKYENVKSDLRQLVYSILERVLLTIRGEETRLSPEDHALVQMLSSTMMEGLCLLLRDNEEGDTLRKLVDQFLFVNYQGINALIHQETRKRSGME
ncbi:TetR family transcriptional regulator [Cohnella terricola]|uniref:TetR family transcriptional regulator n=1 Tax=Cohnella terricola TaxID=1289167 RepID=UPI002482674F|nr:TetR/AcrR family transcriptional regulator [Cohnella terricola]